MAGDDDDALELLSSSELHDLAVKHALHHLDLAFFWRLARALPVAEAAAGELNEAQADVMTLRAHVDDITDSGKGEVAELLRPMYLDYLPSTTSRPERPSANPPKAYRPSSCSSSSPTGSAASARSSCRSSARC